MDDRKPRTQYLYGVTKGKVTQLEVTIDTGTGEVSFGPNVGNTYSEISYERPKGPKVLSRVPQAGQMLSFPTDAALEKNYDFLCAADTNTRQIQGKTLSVTGIVTVTHTNVPGPRNLNVYWKFDVPFALVTSQPKAPPEHLGWFGALRYLQAYGQIEDGMRVGLIVDSDLGNISAYNQRKKPIIGPFYLPPNVQLVYATSDAGKESVVNKSLAVADSIASQTFRAIEASSPPFIVTRTESPWYEGFEVFFPRSKTFTS